MTWNWAENKNATNKLKHKLSFETAVLVFEDPLQVSRPDPFDEEERWQTVGSVGLIGGVHVFVVPHDSARKATSHERRAYEEGTF